MATLRPLMPGDEAALRGFLEPRRASSVFLLGNALAGGLVDRGERPTGTYLGAFDGEHLVAVAAHFWNRNVIVQADPPWLEALLDEFARLRVRPLGGLLGPGEQVAAGLAHLAVTPDELQLDEPEGLYRLALSDLRVPADLGSASLQGRPAQAADLPLLARWRAAYNVETLGHEPGPETDAVAHEMQARALEAGTTWLVEAAGEPVAMAGFNARLPGLVQLGGVWTPPAQRGRGYARAAVAAALLDAREAGDQEAVLFTGDANAPAVRAYQALGFARCGSYRVTLFRAARWEA